MYACSTVPKAFFAVSVDIWGSAISGRVIIEGLRDWSSVGRKWNLDGIYSINAWSFYFILSRAENYENYEPNYVYRISCSCG